MPTFWVLLVASVCVGLVHGDCSMSTLDCGSGFQEVTKPTLTRTHNGCTVKIYHKECYCGSQSSPTSCCMEGGKNIPFKSIYCVKNGAADNQASDQPNCAEATLNWITDTSAAGYEGRVRAAEAALRPKTSWQQSCEEVSLGEGGKAGLGPVGRVVDEITGGAQVTQQKIQEIEDAVPASKQVLTSKAAKALEFKQIMRQKYADGTVRTLSPKNREVFGSKVCDQFESSTCTFSEPSSGSMKDGIRFELKVTPTCSVIANVEIGAAADDQAAYGALEFAPPIKCAANTWLSKKQALEKKVEDQRKIQLLDSLKSSGCPGFGAKNAAYARRLSRDKRGAVEAKYTMDKVISTMETLDQPHRKLLSAISGPNKGSGRNTNTLSNNIGVYTARNPEPKTTSTSGYEQYDSACSM